ncbi:MAG: hypothetical protein HRS50_00780 [Mycoplasmataceae bacterium]|nr:hypothetical protein [Mycoplasmataceae bacterium]
MLMIIFLTIIYFTYLNKKSQKPFLTVRKITIFATFLSLFLIQVFLFKPLLDLPIPFSFDSITIIAVGFIFGPLEGILFGWVADTIRVLIHGWSYQFLPSLMYPMIGIISGLFGLIYWNFKIIPKWKSILIFQVIIIFLFIIVFPIEYGLSIIASSKDSRMIPTLLTTIITFIFMELMFVYIIFSNHSSGNFGKNQMFMLMLITCIALFDRTMELIIRPFTQYFLGYEKNYIIALYTRILSSTYLIPTVSFTSFILIKTTTYVLGLL